MSTTITETRECACTHDDAITCLAQSLRTTRFNAMLLKGHGDIDAGLGGYCTCPCHRGVQVRTVAALQVEGAKRARCCRD